MSIIDLTVRPGMPGYAEQELRKRLEALADKWRDEAATLSTEAFRHACLTQCAYELRQALKREEP